MITSKIIFDQKVKSDVIKCLMGLSGKLKPISYSSDEVRGVTKNLISDSNRFQKFKNKNVHGYFLQSQKAVFNLSFSSVGKYYVDVSIEDNAFYLLLENYLKLISECGIDFGFSCVYEEYLHRNRYYCQLNGNNIESWVGRDLTKYIPGFYWQTFISKYYVERYDLDINRLSQYEFETNNPNGILFQFFKDPSHWKKHSNFIDSLCLELKAVFSIKSIDIDKENNRNVLSLLSALDKWK